MNEQSDFERFVADQLASAAVGTPPESAITETIERAGGSRRLPEWLALIKEPPMRTNSHLGVGSPTVRVATIVAATLLLALTLAAAGAGAQRLLAADQEFVVAQDGSGDYLTISEAVEAAGDDDTVVIRPGNYTERVRVVGKDLIIKGDTDDPEAVVIGAAEAASDDPWSILFEDSASRLSDLTVEGPYEGTAIVIEGSDQGPIIERIVIRVPDPVDMDYAGGAVHWIEGSSGTLLESLVEGTVGIGLGATVEISNNEMPASCIQAYEEDADLVVRGNTIHGCPYEVGISIGAGNTALIEGNDIMVEDVETPTDYWYSSGRIAIEVTGEGTGEITIRDNDIHDSRFGVQHLGGDPAHSPALTIESNRIRDNDMGVSRLVGSPVLTGNTITGSRQIAIELRDSTPTLDGNTLTDNFVGLSLTDAAAPTLNGNTICDNGTNVRLPDGAPPLDTAGNEICADDLAK